MNKRRYCQNFLAVFGILSFTALLTASCSDNSSTGSNPDSGTIHTVQNLEASTDFGGSPGEYVFYNLRENKVVTDSASTNWDIAFSGRVVIANGGESGPGDAGVMVIKTPFNKVEQAPANGYTDYLDTIRDIDNGWYNDTANEEPKHAIIARNDRTLAVKTADGNHYAKVKIISWYKGDPDVTSEEFKDPYEREAGYYTFDYLVQTDGSHKFEN